MRRTVVLGLVAALLAVGAANRLLHERHALEPSPVAPSTQPTGPLLVLEPPGPDGDRVPLVTPCRTLSRVDRRLLEPAGLVKPRYCLLVFGPQAKTRVWIVEAGENLYVDRNANGDLTEPGEAFTPTERREFMTIGEDRREVPYREWTYTVGDLVPGNGPSRHTQFKLVRYQTGVGPAEVCRVRLGRRREAAVNAWLGAAPNDSRDTAPGGSLRRPGCAASSSRGASACSDWPRSAKSCTALRRHSGNRKPLVRLCGVRGRPGVHSARG